MPGAGMGGVQSAMSRALSVESQVGYGFGVWDGYGVLTPIAGFTAAGEQRVYQFGGRLGISERLNLSLEGTRQESAGPQPVNHGVQLHFQGCF